MDMDGTQALDPAVRERVRADVEWDVEEERAWATARLHNVRHRTWLPPDECALCQAERDEA